MRIIVLYLSLYIYIVIKTK